MVPACSATCSNLGVSPHNATRSPGEMSKPVASTVTMSMHTRPTVGEAALPTHMPDTVPQRPWVAVGVTDRKHGQGAVVGGPSVRPYPEPSPAGTSTSLATEV